MGTLHELGESEAPEQGLLLGDDAPGHGGAGRLHDGLAEQVSGERGQEVQTDAAGPCTLPHQRDVGGVATEGGNVILDPLHGHQLVKHARIAGSILRVKIEKSQRGHAILNSNS